MASHALTAGIKDRGVGCPQPNEGSAGAHWGPNFQRISVVGGQENLVIGSRAVCEGEKLLFRVAADAVKGQARTIAQKIGVVGISCLLYTSPSPRDGLLSRMPSSA